MVGGVCGEIPGDGAVTGVSTTFGATTGAATGAVGPSLGAGVGPGAGVRGSSGSRRGERVPCRTGMGLVTCGITGRGGVRGAAVAVPLAPPGPRLIIATTVSRC